MSAWKPHEPSYSLLPRLMVLSMFSAMFSAKFFAMHRSLRPAYSFLLLASIMLAPLVVPAQAQSEQYSQDAPASDGFGSSDPQSNSSGFSGSSNSVSNFANPFRPSPSSPSPFERQQAQYPDSPPGSQQNFQQNSGQYIQQDPQQNASPAFSQTSMNQGADNQNAQRYVPQQQYMPQQEAQAQRPTSGWISSVRQPPQLPPGLVLPVMLDTSLDMNGLKAGDYVQAHLAQNISAGGASYLPGGSIFYGSIADPSGKREKSGKMSIEFVQVKMPNGTLIPLKAHLLGQLENYLNNDGHSHGEGFGQKMMSDGWRGGIGSGIASGFGSVFGAVADGGRGPGSGAFVGAAMGGGSGIMGSLFTRRSHDVILHGGTQMQLQLDSAINLPWSNSGSNRYLPGTGRNTGIF